MRPKMNVAVQLLLAGAVLVVAWLVYAQSSRIDALEQEVETLRDAKPVAVASARQDRGSDERRNATMPIRSNDGEAPKRLLEVLNDVATGEPSEVAQRPEIREALREVVAEEQQIRDQERWQKRLDKQSERTKERVSKFAEAAGVSTASREQIEEMLVAELTEVTEIFREARENFGFREARDKVTAVRAETDQNAKDVLDDDEYVEYQKMREEEIAQFRGPGRRGQNQNRQEASDTKRPEAPQ